MFNYSPFHSFPFAKSDAGSAIVPNIEFNALDLIANFYVTCPRLAIKEEEEHKRILYFYPVEETPKRKVQDSNVRHSSTNLGGDHRNCRRNDWSNIRTTSTWK